MRCMHTQRDTPYNVVLMTEKNTAPSHMVSDEPYLCADLTAGEKQSSKTTGSSGPSVGAKLPNKACNPPVQGCQFGSAGTGKQHDP